MSKAKTTKPAAPVHLGVKIPPELSGRLEAIRRQGHHPVGEELQRAERELQIPLFENIPSGELPPLSLLDAIADDALFAPWFSRNPAGWTAWFAFLKALFGMPMSPEQARGEVADRRADIYSLGVLGYEMVCGEPPFKGTGTFDILSKLLEAPVPRLRDKRPDCPPWLESVIRTALAKKPSERFQTVAQFLDAMERKNVLSNQPPMPMQVSPGAKADAMKKLTPMSAPDGAGHKGQEVRAFVSSPGMKPITVPKERSTITQDFIDKQPAGQSVLPSRVRVISKKRTGSLPGIMRSPTSLSTPSLITAV